MMCAGCFETLREDVCCSGCDIGVDASHELKDVCLWNCQLMKQWSSSVLLSSSVLCCCASGGSSWEDSILTRQIGETSGHDLSFSNIYSIVALICFEM